MLPETGSHPEFKQAVFSVFRAPFADEVWKLKVKMHRLGGETTMIEERIVITRVTPQRVIYRRLDKEGFNGMRGGQFKADDWTFLLITGCLELLTGVIKADVVAV